MHYLACIVWLIGRINHELTTGHEAWFSRFVGVRKSDLFREVRHLTHAFSHDAHRLVGMCSIAFKGCTKCISGLSVADVAKHPGSQLTFLAR